MFILSLGQWKYAKSIANFAKRRYNYKKYWRIKRVGTTQQLTTEQEDILRLLCEKYRDIENQESTIDDFYHEAWEKYSILEDEVDSILEILMHFQYIEKDYKPTISGAQYIEVADKERSSTKECVSDDISKYKKAGKVIAGIIGIAASVATILGFLLSLRN